MKIKLLIAYHKKSLLLKDEILTPIHVGRANADKNSKDYQWLIDNMIGDDTGDNISKKNSSYNELTALYWAWKNYEKLGNPDYIGLMHYRRHFIFDEKDKSIVKNVPENQNEYLDLIKYNRENIERLLKKTDFIYNQGRVSNIYRQYKAHHRIEDLDRVIKILKEKYPEFSKSADEYMEQSYGCFANMFIFPKKMFFEYCEWLFSILATFEEQVDLTNRRLFISERLTGIFVYNAIANGHKGLPLSSTFIEEKLKIDIGFLFNQEETFQTAVLINTIIQNVSHPNLDITFHVFSKTAIDKKIFAPFSTSNDHIHFDFIQYDEHMCTSQFLPVFLGDLLPNVGKLLFLDNRTLTFKSMDVIWEACNTYEFMVVHSTSENNNIFCLNLKLMRYYDVASKARSVSSNNALQFFKENYPAECKKMAYWVLFEVKNATDKDGIYEGISRRDLENEHRVWEKCMLHYEIGLEPWKDLRNVFSIYWWDQASNIPSAYSPLQLDSEALSEQFEKTNIKFLQEYKKCKKTVIKADPLPVEKNTFLKKVLRKSKRILKKLFRRK